LGALGFHYCAILQLNPSARNFAPGDGVDLSGRILSLGALQDINRKRFQNPLIQLFLKIGKKNWGKFINGFGRNGPLPKHGPAFKVKDGSEQIPGVIQDESTLESLQYIIANLPSKVKYLRLG